ncbi:MAG TPA: hypothetical protein VGS01_04335 [Candidatus Limnocylindria bacterium]|nr:hypothetical protein [Candidatus Limnocylindria bacterium]
MNAPHATDIVEGYLARLELALSGSDPARRAELLEDVRAHIAEARAALTEETDAALLAILDRLGDPSAVADGLAEDAPLSDIRDSRTARPIAASRWGLLEAGALLLTFFVWPVGVLLAWLSRSWDRQEKVVATLIGGVAFVIGFPLFAPVVGFVLGPIIGMLGGAAPVLVGTIGALPLASAVYLAVRLGRRGAAFAIA